MVTENWETLTEIQERTKADSTAVVDSVKEAYSAGLAVCRCVDRGIEKVTEWKLKERKA